MTNIYAKIADIDNERIESMEQEMKNSKGVEVQFFHNNNIWGNYDIKKFLDMLLTKYSFIKEVTVHPPLDIYDLELLLLKDKNIIKSKLQDCVEISKKYNVKVNMIFHVTWPIEYTEMTCINPLKDILKTIENTNVTMLLENTFDMEDKDECTVLDMASKIDNPNLKVCIDICHLHCYANENKIKDFDGFLDTYLDKEKCKKYVYQIHFAATLNNDGIVDKRTHGRMHVTLEDLEKDYDIVKKYNMVGKNIITEVSEDNYETRQDQKREITMLEKVINM